jgi:hypothetical protein
MDEVSVFAVADVRQCIAESTMEPPEQWGIYGTGIDPSGATGGDYTVICTLKLEPASGLVSVVALWRKRTGAIASHINAAIEQASQYPGPVWCEYNGVGSQWPEQLGAGLPGIEVTPHYASQSKKQTLYGRLGLAIESGVMRYESGPISEELLSLQYKDGGKIEAAGNSHDDAAEALALALAAVGWNPQQRQWTPGQNTIGAPNE